MLTGYRLLPRTNVVAAQWYFIWDILAAAMAYYIHQVEGFFPILIIQQVQHIFYLTTWDQSWAAKRVISWSSLEWDRGRWNQVDLVVGTMFDIGVHVANTLELFQLVLLAKLIFYPRYFLGTLLSLGSVVSLTMTTMMMVLMIMQGSR